jgi:hypothetical protein
MMITLSLIIRQQLIVTLLLLLIAYEFEALEGEGELLCSKIMLAVYLCVKKGWSPVERVMLLYYFCTTAARWWYARDVIRLCM